MEMIIKLIDQHKRVGRKDVDELLLAKLPEALSEKQKITKIGHMAGGIDNRHHRRYQECFFK